MSQSHRTVILEPSGRSFICESDRTILESGLSAGLALPFSCADGRCGGCLARVLEGDVTSIRSHDYVISHAAKLAGTFLMCACTPVVDSTIEVTEAASVHDIPEQSLTAKLCRIEHLSGLTIVAFKFTRGKAFRFLPGQRAQLVFPSGESAQLPIASCPCNAQFLEFHVPHYGRWQTVCESINALSSRDRVTVSGPVGQFTVSDRVDDAKLFVALGEGFASIQGLMEHVINLSLDAPCCLLWCASRHVTQYRHNLCRSWADAFDNIVYARADTDDDLKAAIENVWNHPLNKCEVYVSCPQETPAALSDRLVAAGVDSRNLHINTV